MREWLRRVWAYKGPFAPRRLDRWRVAHINGYVTDRRVGAGILLAMLAIAAVAWGGAGFPGWGEQVMRLECHEPVPCRNPYRTEEGHCILQGSLVRYCEPALIAPGEVVTVGGRLPWYTEYADALVLAVLIVGVLVNHILHNRRWRP